jgi:DNA-binding response OmpR family regulator
MMTRRVLIVDDEPAVSQFIREVMNSAGMRVLVLTNGAEAAGYLQNEKFEMLLLDLRMPPPDGIEVARQARGSGLNRKTPIIMLSDDQQLSAVSKGFEAGADFFLYKPIDKGGLLRLIRATQGAVQHETRRFRRVEYRARVQLRSDQIECEGETVDLSLNGMLVKAGRCVPAGSAVKVTLDLSPETKPFVGSGSVVRTVGENQMGIEFNLLTPAENGRFQEFLLPLIIQE